MSTVSVMASCAIGHKTRAKSLLFEYVLPVFCSFWENRTPQECVSRSAYLIPPLPTFSSCLLPHLLLQGTETEELKLFLTFLRKSGHSLFGLRLLGVFIRIHDKIIDWLGNVSQNTPFSQPIILKGYLTSHSMWIFVGKESPLKSVSPREAIFFI